MKPAEIEEASEEPTKRPEAAVRKTDLKPAEGVEVVSLRQPAGSYRKSDEKDEKIASSVWDTTSNEVTARLDELKLNPFEAVVLLNMLF